MVIRSLRPESNPEPGWWRAARCPSGRGDGGRRPLTGPGAVPRTADLETGARGPRTAPKPPRLSVPQPAPRPERQGGVGWGVVFSVPCGGQGGARACGTSRPRPWRPRPPPRSAGSRAWPPSGRPESLGCREAGGAGAGPGKPSFESTFFSKPQAGPERGLTHRPGLRGWRGAAGVLPGWGRAPGSCHSPRVSWRQATLHGAPQGPPLLQLFSLHTQPPPLALTHTLTHTHKHTHTHSRLFFVLEGGWDAKRQGPRVGGGGLQSLVSRCKGGICFRAWSRAEESRAGWGGSGDGSLWGRSKGPESLSGLTRPERAAAEAPRPG